MKLTIHIEAEDPNACIDELLSASLKSSPKWSILIPLGCDVRIVEVDGVKVRQITEDADERLKDVLKLAQRAYDTNSQH